VATEDASFYENPGVDAWAVLRAVWINLRGGQVLAGGSTITQQVARTLLLEPEERAEKSLRRKLRETVLAWRLTQRYTKDEILALYLNQTYYGNLAYGVEAAAQTYFGKHVEELDLAECALLAGLPQAPALYNPLEHPEAAKARQSVVLNLMAKQGYITAAQAEQARREPLHFASVPFPIKAPHFVMYVRGLLEREFGPQAMTHGLRVYTTLDLDMQETAERLVRYRLARLAQPDGDLPGHNVHNAALVALDPQTGEILAMLGSPDYFDPQISGAVNATLALRQPGSSIKPITYAAAFSPQSGIESLTAATMVADVRTAFPTREGEPYVPLNYDLEFHGPVLLRQALASSFNIPAVKVLQYIGLERMTALARRFGITTLDDADRFGLALTLGGGEVRLLELTAAYGAFASGGYKVTPVAITRIEDHESRVIRQWAPEPPKSVLDPRVAYLITDILSDDSARIAGFGEGSWLQLSRPAAAKTGTTTDWRDNWTIGYTPDLLVGVWTGNADGSAMVNVTGVTGAAPIWHDFMEEVLRGRPVRKFVEPPGMVRVEICAESGLLPGPDCPHRRRELFIAGTEPTTVCTWHQRFLVDRVTGKRATPACPADQVESVLFTVYPAELADWARERGVKEPPTELCTLHGGLATAWTLEPESRAPRPSTNHVFSASSSLASAIRYSPSVNGSKAALSLISPDQGAIYCLSPELPPTAQRLEIAARPGDGVRLMQLTLFVDGQPLITLNAPPWRSWWELTPGVHRFLAIGTEASGQQLESAPVEITVL